MTPPAASVLVLGGTSWLGGRVAALARDAGHEVTCLARGASGTVPEGVTLVRGDRSRPDAYAALPDRSWDLVVDVSRQPGHVRGALAALSARSVAWAFVSSCSVYASHADHAADETAPLLAAFEGDEAGVEDYGRAKVACEQAVLAARDGAALVARSGLIVGAGDPSERFGYWPARFALAARDGGPVLVPEQAGRPAQWVHVDDLAAWLLTAGLDGTTGVYNASGEAVPLAAVLDACAGATGFAGERVSATDAELAGASVEEFMGPRSLPLWLQDPDWLGFQDRDTSAARAAGLGQRPLSETVRDALAWEEQLGLGRPRTRAGLDRSVELEIVDGLRSARA